LIAIACIMVLGGAGGWYWWQQQLHALPPGIAKTNGRLEAEQVQIATKYAGRISEVLAREGDMVDGGQIVARMDTVELEAQLAAAEADVKQAEHEKVEADALIAQRESERTFAEQELTRAKTLFERGHGTGEKLDQRRNEMKTALAAYDAAVASLEAAKARILAGQAEVARLKSQIDDSKLIAPSRGRIQYKLAQPEEVLDAGGRVFTLLDLSEVYLTIFVSARVAGPLAIGDEARVVLDPMPGYVFPANITFVATEAQFTPKTVETAEEREKLMFRVKLTIDPALRGRYENQVKTGLRGVGFVRTDPNAPWPDNLAVKLP
jgi:HlyD family secretion protein